MAEGVRAVVAAWNPNVSYPVYGTLLNGTIYNLSVVAPWRPRMDILADNNDAFFLTSCGIIIFLMQCGFAFLEAGSVRSKNTTNILIKNLLDSCISALCYWLIGWGLAFGDSIAGIFGSTNFALAYVSLGTLPNFFFQFTFAATAATIVSGALAERCEFGAYFMYCALLTGFVYPILTHWCWNPEGWLKHLGFLDFAGSGVVHLHGASAALIGAAILRPRVGRFTTKTTVGVELSGHSVPFAALGGFILMFGFFAFNGGSQASISKYGDGEVIARSMINTIISGACSTLVALVITRLTGKKKWSILYSINAVLTGMVSACAGCNLYEPWAALIVGCVAGVVYLGVSNLMVKLRIDDPVDAVAVHGGGGLWGLIIAPVLVRGGIVWDITNGKTWEVFGVNILGALVIIVWSAVLLGILFFLLDKFGLFRVSEEVEYRGLDIFKHGEPAYPLSAYGHGWAEILPDGTTMSLIDAQGPVPALTLATPRGLNRYETPEVDIMRRNSSDKVHPRNGTTKTSEKIPMEPKN